MKYNYRKDYTHIFDTPAKMEQESVVVSKIMELLNDNKYDNIYDFITKNPTYQDFLKKHELENVVKHFGNTLNEEDFKKIQSEMVKVTEKKKSFEKENIKTTNIGEEQFVTYEGTDKTTFLDNTHTKDNMSIERQLEELQPTQREFQTTDEKQNTDRMMQELQDSKKETLNFRAIKEIDPASLNEKQRDILRVAANYQLNSETELRVDLDRNLIVDENNNIMKIEEHDGQYIVLGDNSEQKDAMEKEAEKEPKTFQKTLVPSLNTIYSNNAA